MYLALHCVCLRALWLRYIYTLYTYIEDAYHNQLLHIGALASVTGPLLMVC